MVRAWLEKRDLYSGRGSASQLEFSHLQWSAFLLGLLRLHEVRPIKHGGSTLQMSPVFIGRVSLKEIFRQALFNFIVFVVFLVLPYLIGQLLPSSAQRNVFVLHSL